MTNFPRRLRTINLGQHVRILRRNIFSGRAKTKKEWQAMASSTLLRVYTSANFTEIDTGVNMIGKGPLGEALALGQHGDPSLPIQRSTCKTRLKIEMTPFT